MTMLTQKKLNLQMKILKIAKGLNKFTLPDILPMLEENEKTIQKALKTKLPQRRQQPEKVKEARRLYNILYRKKFMASMRKYLDHHLAVFLWKELNPNFEDQLNLIYELIHI